MMRYTVLTAPDPRLKIVAKPVACVDTDIQCLMNDMLETMYAEEGYGLAATQIGIDKRIIVMDLNQPHSQPNPSLVFKMVNPEIYRQSSEISKVYESCISVPDQHGMVERPARVSVRYLDENNMLQNMEASELTATCVQHEIDHLNGILYIDRLSRLKREIILRKLAKSRKFAL
jgi:peptide deformylase